MGELLITVSALAACWGLAAEGLLIGVYGQLAYLVKSSVGRLWILACARSGARGIGAGRTAT